ncbi:MAG TPA: autotransporter-associated beta strand repeat-containing protein [Tepidisphaeraceae bacterium]
MAVSMAGASSAVASSYYWDINGSGTGGSNTASASGVWNGTALNWNSDASGGSGGSFAAEVGAGNVAVFSAGGNTLGAGNVTGSSTITVVGTHSVSAIEFFSGQTILTGGGLDFSGLGTIQLDRAVSGPQGRIDSVISGSAGLSFVVTGALATVAGITLGGANTYSGTTQIGNRVQLTITNAQALGGPGAVVFDPEAVSQGTQLRLSNVGTIAGKDVVLRSGGFRTNGGQLNNIAGNNTWAGAIILNGSTVNEGGIAGVGANAGTTLTVAGPMVSGTSATGASGKGWAKTGAGTVVLTQPNPNMLSLVRVFDGKLVVTGDQQLGTASTPGGVGEDVIMSSLANNLLPSLAFSAPANSGGFSYLTYEQITTSGKNGADGGSIQNLNGHNTFAGDIRCGAANGSTDGSNSLTTSFAISGGSSLELSGKLWRSTSGTNRLLVKTGGGDLIISGSNTTADGATSQMPLPQYALAGTFLVQEGALVVRGAHGAMSSGMGINVNPGAALVLDDSAVAANHRLGASAVSLVNGELKLRGHETDDSVQEVQALVTSGHSTVTLLPPPATGTGTAELKVSAVVARQSQGTLLVRGLESARTVMSMTGETLRGGGGDAGSATISILPYAVGDLAADGVGSELVTVGNGTGSGRVRVLAANEYRALASGETGAVNAVADGDVTLAGATNVNALKFVGTSAAISVASGLDINSGALLSMGVDQTISGGQLRFGGWDTALPEVATSPAEGVVFVNGDLTIASEIGGAAGLTKSGLGALVLANGGNWYAGPTVVNAGVLAALSDGALGAADGALVLNGGTFAPLATMTLNSSRPVQVNAAVGNAFDIPGGVVLTIAGPLTSQGKLTKVGGGTLLLSNGGASLGGALILQEGGVGLSSPAQIGTTPITFGGGNLLLAGSGNYASAMVMEPGSNALIKLGGGVLATASGLISGNADLVLSGPGVFNPTANNTYSGRNIVTGGATLRYTSGTAFAVTNGVPGHFTLNEGTLQFLGQQSGQVTLLSPARDVVVGPNGGTIDVQQNASPTAYTVSLSGAITGSGDLSKTGDGRLRLGAQSNGISGQTKVLGGILELPNGVSLSSASVKVSGGQLINNGTITGDITAQSGGTLRGGGTFNSSMAILGGGAFAPGNSPGTATVGGNLTLGPGGVYKVEISDATGVAGQGWDTINIINEMLVTADAGAPFVIDVASSGTQGLANNFDASQAYHWVIAHAGGGVVDYGSAKFEVVWRSFQNPTANPSGPGAFVLTQSGNDLVLNFDPVPEAGSAVGMLLAGSIGLLRRRRRSFAC